jgi:hypothetical protein
MITVVTPLMDDARLPGIVGAYARSPLISRILVMRQEGQSLPEGRYARRVCRALEVNFPGSGKTVSRVIEAIKTKYLLWVRGQENAALFPGALDRLIGAAEETGAGLVYGDDDGYPVNDYQLGSIRDTFDFGPVLLFRMDALHRCLNKYGTISASAYAGLYDLRLKLSMDERLFHLNTPLSAKKTAQDSSAAPSMQHFAYVDPRNRAYQAEMERVATEHLKRLGA